MGSEQGVLGGVLRGSADSEQGTTDGVGSEQEALGGVGSERGPPGHGRLQRKGG